MKYIIYYINLIYVIYKHSYILYITVKYEQIPENKWLVFLTEIMRIYKRNNLRVSFLNKPSQVL